MSLSLGCLLMLIVVVFIADPAPTLKRNVTLTDIQTTESMRNFGPWATTAVFWICGY